MGCRLQSTDPKLYWEHSLRLFSIYDYYEDYPKVKELLDHRQASFEGIRTKINLLLLKRRIARNNIKLATVRPAASARLLADTAALLGEVFEDYEYYLLEHPLEKLKMEFLQAKTRLMQNPSLSALQLLTDLATRIEEKLQAEHTQGEQQPAGSCLSELYIEVYTELGDSCFLLFRNSQDALGYYARAFERARAFFGDIYNEQCAKLL